MVCGVFVYCCVGGCLVLLVWLFLGCFLVVLVGFWLVCSCVVRVFFVDSKPIMFIKS